MSADAAGPKAIPFITQQASGGLAIEAEAAAFLRSVEAPVCVVAVVGVHRTGKSYLLNSLLLQDQNQKREGEVGGFKVGNGLSTCTKGVWIYNQVVQLPRPDGTTARLLVLDTEGTGGADGDQERDVLTWSLTLLLSSYLIYNSVGSIDEQSILQLSLVTHVAQLLHIRDPSDTAASSPSSVAAGVAELFPSFLWLLRDFTLELVTPTGEPITEDQYLDRALQPVDAAIPEAESKNATRKTLRECFRHLHCCTLVRPAIDEEILQNLGTADLSQTREAFQQQLGALRGMVLNDCREKHIRGAPVGGAGLLALSESFVAAVSGSDGPAASLADAYTDAAKAMAEHALKDARGKLHAALQSLASAQQPLADGDLETCVADAARASRRSLQSNLGFSADAVAQAAIEKLESDIASQARAMRVGNDAKAEEMLARFYSEVDRGLAQGRYASIQQYLADHARVRACCAEQVSRAVLAEFLERRLQQGVAQMAAALQQDVEDERAALAASREALAASEQALAQIKDTLKESECASAGAHERSKEVQEAMAALQTELSACKQDLERAEAKVDRVCAERDSEVERLLAQHAVLEAEREGTLQQRGLLAVTEQSLARAEAQVAELRREVERLETKCSRLDVERESALHQASEASQELAASASALQGARQRNSELERAAMEAAASRRQVEEEARERVERAEAAREHSGVLAEAQRAAVEAKVQQLADRVAELKEDKENLRSTLSEVMGRAGDASVQSEAQWKERMDEADANARRKVEQMRKANEEALAAVTRTFESEREALCLRVSSLEQQVADAAAEAELRRTEQMAMSNDYEAAIDELERELKHAAEMMRAMGDTAQVAHKVDALSQDVVKGQRNVGAALAAMANASSSSASSSKVPPPSAAAAISGAVSPEVVTSMSRIIAAKEAEVEDMREAADGTVVRLRALIEHKDTENARLQRYLKIFMNHCFKAQCRYCGREVETRSAIDHIPACMARRNISGYQLLVETPPCLQWQVEVDGTATRSCDGQTKTVYLISVRRGDVHTCVSRRYSDIVKLHTQLKQRLPRITLPEFKPMRGGAAALFAASEDLVFKRRRQIAAFLCQLLQLAVVADSTEMQIFLSQTEEKLSQPEDAKGADSSGKEGD